MLSLKFLILILSLILKFSFSSEEIIAKYETCVNMKKISNVVSPVKPHLIKINSQHSETNHTNSFHNLVSPNTHEQSLIYPNKNIFQNHILPFLNTNDSMKIIRAFEFKKINVEDFFPNTFHVKNVVSLNENAKFCLFPESPNLNPVLFLQNRNKFLLLKADNNLIDIDENLDYVLIENVIPPFKFKYSRFNKEKNKTFDVLLAISEKQFIVALKKTEKIKIIWHGHFTHVSKVGGNRTLDLGKFQISFPQDVDIILNSRKYSKKKFSKILRRYLNLIARYHKFVLPNLNNKKIESCIDFTCILLFLISIFCGYSLILALPSFLETNLIFLPLLWQNPQFIFYTSFFAAMASFVHMLHFETETINECWLFPHLKAWTRDKICTTVHIFVIWGIINLQLALCWILYPDE